MGGIPVNFPSFLLQALDNLVSNTGYKYVDTFDDYEQTISSNFQLIASIPDDKTMYQVRIRNNSNQLVFLRIGEPKSQEPTDKSTALTIQPNSTYIRDISGCEIYARIDGETTLQINILTEVLQSHQEEQMTIPLQLQLMIGTGSNKEQNKSFYALERFGGEWKEDLDYIAESRDYKTGYKVIRLVSFQPSETYTLNFKTSDFNGLDKSKEKPFRIYLIPYFSLLEVAGSMMFSIPYLTPYSNQSSDFFRYSLGTLKQNNKIASIGIGETSIDFTPVNGSIFIHVDASTTSGPDGCIITDYDPVNQTITIGGV